MCKVISIVSWKGGVGKTTSTVNISSYLSMQGKKVCAVDLDPQHSLSKHFGIFPGNLKGKPTIYDLLNAAINDCDEDIDELVHKSIYKSTTVDVIPATPKLSALDKVLPTATCREQLLKGILSYIKDEYDYHNTFLLLSKYRDVVWSLEVSARKTESRFIKEMGCNVEEYLDSVHLAGFEFSESGVQERTKIIEQSTYMLKVLEAAIETL